jgi:hypothetical protein
VYYNPDFVLIKHRNTIKNTIKRFTPEALHPSRLKMHWNTVFKILIKFASTERFFTRIYQQNSWGGQAGDYFSGTGSADNTVTDPYVACISTLSRELPLSKMQAVDLGCGDMRVGSRISPLFASYLGVDIVKDLIAHHQNKFGSPQVRFAHLNIIDEPLPPGNFCMLRQVLQHLSNAQIQKILAKLAQYDYVLITEHMPLPHPKMVVNIDMPRNADTRLPLNSGVFLTAPPFNIPDDEITTVLEVPSANGIIRTMLYQPTR